VARRVTRRQSVWCRTAKRLLTALALFGSVPFSPSYAQPSDVILVEGRVSTVRVTSGKSQVFRTSRGYVDLVVGNPETADVMPLSDRSLYVLGKKPGATNVSIFDAEKKLVGVVEVEVAADLIKADREIRAQAPAAQLRSSQGQTVLSGTAPDAIAAARAQETAKRFGGEVVNTMRIRSPQQVMLEVRFIEANRTASKELGVNWRVLGENFGSPTRAARNVMANSGIQALAGGGTPFGEIIGRVLSNGIEADIIIQALEERGMARRLAEPNLVALSGEKASFLAGGEFPIPIQAENGRITVEFKRFGVGLTFVPTVLADGNIHLQIEPEVSQIDPTNSIRTVGIAIPALIVRRANTVIQLQDGQSFAIAGLLQSLNTNTLADVPILGALFKSAAFERNETELAIIVTPRLVKPAKPGQRLRTPLDSTLPPNEVDLFLMGKNEILKEAVLEVTGTLAKRETTQTGTALIDFMGGNDVAAR
jgi:pilus assembly protein CpaC